MGEEEKVNISAITHPSYDKMVEQWQKFRLTFEGGKSFKTEYLKKFTTRETDNDYNDRFDLTYVPAFAKSAVIEIKNAIFNRMVDVKRIGGSTTYQSVIDGSGFGVDRQSSSMNAFMGSVFLPELLSIGKVGIYVDQPELLHKTGTRLDDVARIPYLYLYQAEQIRSWQYDSNNTLVSVLLQATVDEIDEHTGLVTATVTEYRLFQLRYGAGVAVTIYNEHGEVKESETVYPWVRIPLDIVEIPSSIMTDAADYQIALMNMASANVNYDVKANFPFYVEQSDPLTDAANMRSTANVQNDSDDGTATKARTAADHEITVGATKGRRYRGEKAPEFINPSAEPMEASIGKQESMKREIRQLVQLAITNMDPRRESADSKALDERGLEAGLSYLAQIMERSERNTASFWSMYEKSTVKITIKYPEDYTMRTNKERADEAKDLIELSKSSPSITYQKEMAKQAATATLGSKVTNDTLEKIKKEIDEADVPYVEPAALATDVEQGLATTSTVSKIRGYPEGEAEKAAAQQAEKAALIVAAQSKEAGGNTAARGVPELDPDPKSPEKEKEISQSRDRSVDGSKGVRS